MVKRPTVDAPFSSYVTTPHTAQMMQLLGSGLVAGAVALSRDEYQAINKLYGYKTEPPNERPAPPDPLPVNASYEEKQAHKAAQRIYDTWEDPQPLFQAGADRDAIRQAECDGLRLLAWLASHVGQGEDPLKIVVQLAIDAGWDVDPADVEWAETDNDA